MENRRSASVFRRARYQWSPSRARVGGVVNFFRVAGLWFLCRPSIIHGAESSRCHNDTLFQMKKKSQGRADGAIWSPCPLAVPPDFSPFVSSFVSILRYRTPIRKIRTPCRAPFSVCKNWVKIANHIGLGVCADMHETLDFIG